MNAESLYLACFIIGLILCLLSVLGGMGHIHGGHFHFGSHSGHLAVGHAGAPGHLTHPASAHVPPHAPSVATARSGRSSARGMSPVNGFTITAFLCWFGGTGYLLRTHSSFAALLVLLLASVSGLAGAAVVFWFLSAVLLPHERTLSAEDTEMIGVVGTVSGALRPGGTGEILFSQLGVRRSAPARSEDNLTIERNAEVIVMRYEHGVAYVRRWEDLAP